MENASKALIIAGAILLAIVIISLGLVVVNNVRNVTDDTNLSEQEIQSFNAKFISYEGDSVSGSRVNTLIQQVIATNQANYDSGENFFIDIAFKPINYPDNINGIDYYAWITLKIDGDMNWASVKKNAIQPDSTGVISSSVIDDINKKDNDKGINKKMDTKNGNINPPTLSVDTGKNFKVKIYYQNGRVKAITAIAN